jgi:hypothetical protein
MRMKIQMIVVATALLVGVGTVPVFGQTDEHGKMSGMKMTGKKMSHDEAMAAIDKMSVDDKAAMVDKMSAKDKAAATKTAGHDMSKMSAQDKADMFDKMPMDKKMSMMNGDSTMHKGGMSGKMGKMGKTDK